MPKRKQSFSDEIRDAIRESPYTQYAICRATGLDKGALSRFVSGERGLELANVDKLAEFLGLHVTGPDDSTKGERDSGPIGPGATTRKKARGRTSAKGTTKRGTKRKG